MKICKDCKYFSTRFIYRLLDAKTNEIFICTKNVGYKINVVTGIKEPVSGEGILCEKYRDEASEIPNKCGPEGKHFEAKE